MKSIILSVVLLVASTLAAFGQSGPWNGVESALGKKGVEQGGIFKVSFPRTDLKITKAGVPVTAGVALTSWMGFVQNKGQTMGHGRLGSPGTRGQTCDDRSVLLRD